MFGILEAVAVPHSGIFGTYEELMTELNDRMGKDGYKVVKARSHRGHTGADGVTNTDIVRCDLVCDRGGRPYKCMAVKHKTSTKKTGCPWKAKAVNRKTIGGWVLTISCDQHNHEPGTPEPPSPGEVNGLEDNGAEEVDDTGPRPDPHTSTALQLAGVSEAAFRLSGDAFHQLKVDYRKLPQSERLNTLAQMQLRIAAIYAIQNEDIQRQRRQDAQERRHRGIDGSKKQLSGSATKAKPRRSKRPTATSDEPDSTPLRGAQDQQALPLPQAQQQQPIAQQQQHQQHQQHQQQHQQQQQHQPHHHQQHMPMTPDGVQQQMMHSGGYQLDGSPMQQTPVPIPGMPMSPFRHYSGPQKR